jgi:uncharacterized membrane protein YkoI
LRWLPTACAVWRERRVRLALGGLALAVAFSLAVSLVRQARMGVIASAPAAEPQPIDVSFQTADAAPSDAQTGQGSRNVRNSQGRPSQVLSRAQAVALVQRRYRARVVRSHFLQNVAGRPVYEFRLLAAGTVWDVRIDAYTGAQVP